MLSRSSYLHCQLFWTQATCRKLVHYGVTYVLARDGFSGKIVGTSIMSLKNNEVIYEDVFAEVLA